jgi:hypothetical protein
MLSKRGLRSCTTFNAAAADKDGYADFCKAASQVLPPNSQSRADAAGTLGGLADEVALRNFQRRCRLLGAYRLKPRAG